jgi:hypothetical protein
VDACVLILCSPDQDPYVVVARVADGLHMPDESRVLLGLAPAEATISTFTATQQRGTDQQIWHRSRLGGANPTEQRSHHASPSAAADLPGRTRLRSMPPSSR